MLLLYNDARDGGKQSVIVAFQGQNLVCLPSSISLVSIFRKVWERCIFIQLFLRAVVNLREQQQRYTHVYLVSNHLHRVI